MTAKQTLAFVLFAIVAAITPGPSNIILTSTGAHVGVLRGLPCLFGVAIGMGLMMFIVAFGLGSLVLENTVILQGLRLRMRNPVMKQDGFAVYNRLFAHPVSRRALLRAAALMAGGGAAAMLSPTSLPRLAHTTAPNVGGPSPLAWGATLIPLIRITPRF